ncbi:MAG: arsenate reductase ArsC [Desulfotignum sp.]|nr:arsenate reductase ArsC [Desulfotignum sp.]MCF8126465.1 arsenate reductase ArsC [Desulfotignum sp.]
MGDQKLKILFLCTGNACRSQMAEGWIRHLKNDVIDVFSAGVETYGVDPRAVAVMKEAGVDISLHRSKHVSEFQDKKMDLVITVCDNAKESCPYFPFANKKVHRGFADPPALAKDVAQKGGDENAQLDCYRKVRDEIRAFVEKLPDNVLS